MTSELTYRRHEHQPTSNPYSPKPSKPWSITIRPIRYILHEQRLVFTLIGIALATIFFILIPSSTTYKPISRPTQILNRRTVFNTNRYNSGGKIPLGLKRKGLRVLVTGGAGFVGSHLVDRLIERGDSVIVVDNFFTGNKENIMHHFGNAGFELIRHDVVQPLLLEVDQIYHLACPASPVHYKFNPVKTIISFFLYL